MNDILKSSSVALWRAYSDKKQQLQDIKDMLDVVRDSDDAFEYSHNLDKLFAVIDNE